MKIKGGNKVALVVVQGNWYMSTEEIQKFEDLSAEPFIFSADKDINHA